MASPRLVLDSAMLFAEEHRNERPGLASHQAELGFKVRRPQEGRTGTVEFRTCSE